MTKGSKQSKAQKFWFDHIKTWKKSDLNLTDYCKRHNLSRQCFYQWKAKAKLNENDQNKLVPVKIMHSSPESVAHPSEPELLEIILSNGVRCRFPVRANPDNILPWLSDLKALA